jgi:endonuclease-3 related protein
MVGAVLTQNTAWANVEKAIRDLKGARVLTPAGMQAISVGRLSRLIRPAGYYNVKAKRLKNLVSFLFSEYGGSLKKAGRETTAVLRRKLLAVNGIGPETCDSILLYAFQMPVFVVDAYTKRIFARHSFLKEDAPYHDVQRLFADNLPPDAKMFNEYHALIVRLAKDFCRKSPRCGECPLRAQRRKLTVSRHGRRLNSLANGFRG